MRHPAPQTVLPIETVQRTMSVGIQQISERYVDYLPVSVLALEGVRGLNVIDPDFEAVRENDTVLVSADGVRRHAMKAPDDADADAWAALMVDAVQFAQEDSALISIASVDQIYEAMFDGSLSLLDTYSRYSGASEATQNREKRSGFGGIGVVVRKMPRGASVIQVLADSPAIRAGLVEGDIITHVDERPVEQLEKPTELGRGPIGTSVSLRVEKLNGKIVDLDVQRQRVIAPTVETVVRNGIVSAKISGFNRSTARELSVEVGEAVARLGGDARGLVLDLRGNPGGLLSEAVRVADLFISEGRILTTHGRHPGSIHEYWAREDDIASGIPIVVLVNGRSASASEIVAAALQDHDRAIVVGSSSYGKGTVQMVISLPNEGELTVTWSQFITPSGYVLNGLGVHPSVCTSTVGENADQLIRHAVQTGRDLTHIFEMWRGIDRYPETDRKNLKALCPPSDSLADIDDLVAESVIADNDLYQRIMAFAPTILAAHK